MMFSILCKRTPSSPTLEKMIFCATCYHKLCDICGAVGFSEDLITCFGCRQACEHIYCMRAQVLYVPAMWFCESCQARDVNHVKTTNLGENDKHNLSVQPPSSKPLPRMLSRGSSLKHGETSKVKFIPTEEAALLTSGAQKKGSPLKGSLVAKSSTPSYSGMPKTGTSKAFLKIGNPIFSSGPLPGCSKPATQPRVQFSTSPLSPSAKMPQDSLASKSSSLVCKPSSTEILTGAKHLKDDLSIRRPLYVSSRPGSCKVSFQRSAESIDKVCHSPSKFSRHPDSIFNTNIASPSNNKNLIQGLDKTPDIAFLNDDQLKNSDFLRSDLPLDFSGFSKVKLPNHLDPDALWKGNFEIFDAVCHSDSCDGIQAHRPIILSRKVCEFLKHLPHCLQFEMQPRLNIWPCIFFNGCPTAHDIALYFLPGERQSSQKRYIDLLERIEKHDFAMRSCLGGVELLVFTSKQLPMDSQRLNMQTFLWGVFHHVKHTSVKYHVGGPLYCSPISDMGTQKEDGDLLEQGNLNYQSCTFPCSAEVVDMEIDMMGGKDVGIIDKPVARPVPLSC